MNDKLREAIEVVAGGNDKDVTDLLKFYRDESQFEMNVLGARVSWLLAAQAFLVTASTIALSNAVIINTQHTLPTQHTELGSILSATASVIAWVGFMIARKSSDAIDRAKETVTVWLHRTKMLADARQTVRNDCKWRHELLTVRVLGRWIDKIPEERVAKQWPLLNIVRGILHPLFTSVGPKGPNDPFHHESMQFSNIMPRLFAWYWVFLFTFSAVLTVKLDLIRAIRYLIPG